MAGSLIGDNEPIPPIDTSHIFDGSACKDASGYGDGLVEKILDADKRYDKKDFLVLIGLQLFVLLVIFAKGGPGMKSFVGVEKCSLSWALLQVIIILALFALSSYLSSLVIHRTNVRQFLNVPTVKGDVIWDCRSTFKFMIQFFLASVISSVIGIGSGIILIPLLLSKGYLPQVAAATSMSLVAVTSFTSTVAFVVSGVAPLDYSLFFGVFCFCGAFIGKRAIDWLIRKYIRPL